jgi:hypothetical protein
VDKFFQTLRSFTRQIRKQEGIRGGKISMRIKKKTKTLAMLASGIFSAKPEFHSRWASWQVDIRTPDILKTNALALVT